MARMLNKEGYFYLQIILRFMKGLCKFLIVSHSTQARKFLELPCLAGKR